MIDRGLKLARLVIPIALAMLLMALVFGVACTPYPPPPTDAPPQVSIVAPKSGAKVSGVVTIQANASDDKGVAAVGYTIDGGDPVAMSLVSGTAQSGLWQAAWNTTAVASGAHTLAVIATDAVAQTATDTIQVTVDKRPAVAIVSPKAAAKVFGVVTINASASDDNGVVSVKYSIDGGAPVAMSLVSGDAQSGQWQATWDTGAVASGAHTLRVMATDAVPHTATHTIQVTVDQPPVVAVISPSAGATVLGVVTIQAGATDDNGVVSVEYSIDGGPPVAMSLVLGDAQSGLWQATWDTATAASGAKTITVTATDIVPRTAADSILVLVDKSPAVSIVSPTAEAPPTAGDIVTIQASASDDFGIAGVSYSIDGGAPVTMTYNAVSGYYEGDWDTTGYEGDWETEGVGGAVADDSGVQMDETTAANNAVENDMTLLPADPAVNDAYYFGHVIPFGELRLNVGTAGVGTWTLAWEYWNGAAWSAFPRVVIDYTEGFTVAGENRVIFITIPPDWVPSEVAGITNFWIRARVSTFTEMTTQPLGTQALAWGGASGVHLIVVTATDTIGQMDTDSIMVMVIPPEPPVLQIGDEWTYSVTYDDPENAYWERMPVTETVEAVGVIIDGVACYYSTLEMYPQPPDWKGLERYIGGTSITLTAGEKWISIATLDPAKTEYDMLAAFSEINTYTYLTAEHGWPLEVGKTWSYELHAVIYNLLDVTLDRTATVEAIENVSLRVDSVPVTFAGYKIVHRDGATGDITLVEWWSPQVKNNVKVIDYATYDGTETAEFWSYYRLEP